MNDSIPAKVPSSSSPSSLGGASSFHNIQPLLQFLSHANPSSTKLASTTTDDSDSNTTKATTSNTHKQIRHPNNLMDGDLKVRTATVAVSNHHGRNGVPRREGKNDSGGFKAPSAMPAGGLAAFRGDPRFSQYGHLFDNKPDKRDEDAHDTITTRRHNDAPTRASITASPSMLSTATATSGGSTVSPALTNEQRSAMEQKRLAALAKRRTHVLPSTTSSLPSPSPLPLPSSPSCSSSILSSPNANKVSDSPLSLSQPSNSNINSSNVSGMGGNGALTSQQKLVIEQKRQAALNRLTKQRSNHVTIPTTPSTDTFHHQTHHSNPNSRDSPSSWLSSPRATNNSKQPKSSASSTIDINQVGCALHIIRSRCCSPILLTLTHFTRSLAPNMFRMID
jgi:hypothetical protein